MERGIAVRQGARFLQAALPDILGRHAELLSARMVQVIGELSGDLHHLNQRLDAVTAEIETLAKADDACQRMMTVPGIGPIIAGAMVSAVGDGAAFGSEPYLELAIAGRRWIALSAATDMLPGI